MLVTKFKIIRNGKTVFSEQGVELNSIAFLSWVGQKMDDAGLYATDFLVVTAKEVSVYKDGEIIGARRRTKIRTTDAIWKTICNWEEEVLPKEES